MIHKKEYHIEICANSAESCLKAQDGGAYRVELCAGMPEGGTTPSWGEICAARRLLTSTRLHVIIRPRSGDFLYSDLELNIMAEDIRAARKAGADGVVFGCLTPDGDVDMHAMEYLMEVAAGMSVTFHRAFDMCREPILALEQIITLGCDRILTSGQESTAEKGVVLLKDLVERAGKRIVIMPGCGVCPRNIANIAKITGASEFHFSGREGIESGMEYRNPRVSMGGEVKIDEYIRNVTSSQIVNKAVKILEQIK